ncbi:MAG: septal ring lytic transglycosylase RlpA family protein [Ignavibacteriaceae bacterium]|nr:septal ring lytic transglycosylase RlpA family protein [Ignavibacteriaceae bacterium]
MRSLVKLFLFLMMIALVGFTIVSNEEDEINTSETNDDLISETIELNPINFSMVTLTELGTMKSSWYGPGFHGKKTANGEIYDQMSLTAAHKSLKFGTLLKVTNPRNSKSVVVRINDRGPYIEGRDLDLSKAAAMELGLMRRGVAKMKIEKIHVNDISSPIIAIN